MKDDWVKDRAFETRLQEWQVRALLLLSLLRPIFHERLEMRPLLTVVCSIVFTISLLTPGASLASDTAYISIEASTGIMYDIQTS